MLQSIQNLSPLEPLAPSQEPLVSQQWRLALVSMPLAIVVVYTIMLANSWTRHFAILMTKENYPVEAATFVFLLLASIQGLILAQHSRRLRGWGLWRAFYFAFSALLFFTAMEEVAWGQWFFHFHTPEAMERINVQGEFTLHNIEGMSGHTEWLRLGFGVGGLFGIALSWISTMHPISVPRILWTWFATITFLSMADLWYDFVPGESNLSKVLDVLSEVVEMLIGAAALLYLWLKDRSLKESSG